MKRTMIAAMSVLLTASLAGNLSANLVVPADSTITPDGPNLLGTTTYNANLNSIAAIESQFGVQLGDNDPNDGIDDITTGTLLYKMNVDPENGLYEDGVYANSYDTTWITTTGVSGAWVVHVDGTSYINGPLQPSYNSLYLIVKDGNHTPAQYLFDFSWWDGQSDFYLSGFWPADGAISNLAIWGANDLTPSFVPSTVPEPASLAIWSLVTLGAAGVASRRRRRWSDGQRQAIREIVGKA